MRMSSITTKRAGLLSALWLGVAVSDWVSAFVPLEIRRRSNEGSRISQLSRRTLTPRPDRCARKHTARLFAHNSESEEDGTAVWKSSRRQFLFTSALVVPLLPLRPSSSSARGLVQFPCTIPLANSYHFMRAGTTLLEEEGMWSTNPLFLTNRDDALSPAGEDQVVAACELLKQGTRPPTLVKYSLAASSIDTANIVGRELKLGRDRLVPEFTFLDPRAVGAWDMSAKATTLPAVFAMDNDEAGSDGLQGRPPANEDGTPHEVLADQAVRLRQLMSILESQYSGDTILLIFPDGTGPALLSAMIAGIPYYRVHELEFGPGEVRFEVTMDSTLALWKTKQLEDGEAHLLVLQQGRENLKQLRATANSGGTVVNLKDKKIEEERIAIDEQMKEQERKRVKDETEEQGARLKRQREVQAQRNEGSSAVSLTALGVAAISLIIGASFGAGTDREEATATNTTVPETPGLPTEPILEGDNDVGTGLHAGRGNFASEKIGPILDPKEAAERAMEEYMNKDDGVDDWLVSLSQIIEEPEVEDVDEDLMAQALSLPQIAEEPEINIENEDLVPQVVVSDDDVGFQ